jgi:hypothetical protein
MSTGGPPDGCFPGHRLAGERRSNPEPERLRCVGGPFDGEGVGSWQHANDNYEVFLGREPTCVRSGRPAPRTHGAWASDLRDQGAPGDVHLGYDRLDFTAGHATWVPA